jgi:IPT/TIG domain
MKIICIFLIAILWAGCGYSNKSNTPAQPGVVPKLNALVPDSANAGDPAFTLTVNGTGFATNAMVKWNGAVQPTTYVTGSQLTAAIAATNLGTSGPVSVTVTNPGTPGGQYGGGTNSETSNMVTFTIN